MVEPTACRAVELWGSLFGWGNKNTKQSKIKYCDCAGKKKEGKQTPISISTPVFGRSVAELMLFGKSLPEPAGAVSSNSRQDSKVWAERNRVVRDYKEA